MKKIIEFVRKYYIFFTIAIAIILVIIGSIIVIKLINNNKHKITLRTENQNVYQYVNDQKKEYSAKIYYEDEKIVTIKSGEYVPYDNSIIYYQDKDSVILPKETMIVFYYQNNLSYKMPRYVLVNNDSASNVIALNGKTFVEDSFLIYDNEDMYFFTNDVLLNINNNEINLGKYSYIVASQNSITYYNYGTKEIYKLEDTITKAVISFGNIKIDLLTDSLVYNSKVRMLNKDMSTLKVYKED